MANQGDERAKNPTDPVAHPSLFFRRSGQSTKNTSIVAYQKKVMRRHDKEKAYQMDLERKIVEQALMNKQRPYSSTT